MGSFPGLEGNGNYWDMNLSTHLSPELLSSARSTKNTESHGLNITEKKKLLQTSKHL